MKCLMFEEIGKLAPSEIPEPTFPVWIKVAATGICGTDLKSVYVGHRYFRPPTVLGHEFYGQICKAPEGYPLKNGTWVVAAPYYECGKCDYCKAGKGDLCENKNYVEAGSFAEYVGVPLDYMEGLFVLPEKKNTDDYDVYALTEPLACVINGTSRLETIPGYSKVLIVGGGPMGALFALYYASKGIEAAIVEPNDERTAKLQSWGIKTVKQDQVQKGEYDNVVIAVNIAKLVSDYLPLVRHGGTLLVFSGLPKGESLDIDAGAIHYNEVSIKGCSGFGLDHFKESFSVIKANEKLFRQLITNKFDFEHGQQAFDMLKAGKAFKILIGSDINC
jgi:L-iditol 2-dehydrogenase